MSGLRARATAEHIARRVRRSEQHIQQDPSVPTYLTDQLVAGHVTRARRPVAPTTRKIDERGRFRLNGLTYALGDFPGPLDCRSDGDWLVLTPAADVAACEAKGEPTVDMNDRVLLPHALRNRLAVDAVDAGDEVLVAVLADHGAVAVAHRPSCSTALRSA